MPMFWAQGVDGDGNFEIMGPFELAEQADVEADLAGLNNVHVFQAPNRDVAEQRARGRSSSRRRFPLSPDQPLPIRPAFNPEGDQEEF
jgi:hypothetical protein